MGRSSDCITHKFFYKRAEDKRKKGDKLWVRNILVERMLDLHKEERELKRGGPQTDMFVELQNERQDVAALMEFEKENREGVLRSIREEGIERMEWLVLQYLRYLVAKKDAGLRTVVGSPSKRPLKRHRHT